MGLTSVRNARDDREIKEGEVYVGRPSMWGNPFTFDGEDERSDRYHRASREEAIDAYRNWLWACIGSGAYTLASLRLLHGKVLVCWCSPLPCHADVLARAADWAVEQP